MEQAVQRRQAIGWLFLVTLVWGGTFVWMKEALNAADNYLTTWHLASVVAFMIVIRLKIPQFNRMDWSGNISGS